MQCHFKLSDSDMYEIAYNDDATGVLTKRQESTDIGLNIATDMNISSVGDLAMRKTTEGHISL